MTHRYKVPDEVRATRIREELQDVGVSIAATYNSWRDIANPFTRDTSPCFGTGSLLCMESIEED